MEIRSIIGDAESEEVKLDFRVISWTLNESGSFCNRNNNPPVLTTATRLLLKAPRRSDRERSSGHNFCGNGRRAAVKARTIAH